LTLPKKWNRFWNGWNVLKNNEELIEDGGCNSAHLCVAFVEREKKWDRSLDNSGNVRRRKKDLAWLVWDMKPWRALTIGA